MIKLYGFGSGLGVVDQSPFVAIVIAYLKIADTPFEAINSADNLQKAPSPGVSPANGIFGKNDKENCSNISVVTATV